MFGFVLVGCGGNDATEPIETELTEITEEMEVVEEGTDEVVETEPVINDFESQFRADSEFLAEIVAEIIEEIEGVNAENAVEFSFTLLSRAILLETISEQQNHTEFVERQLYNISSTFRSVSGVLIHVPEGSDELIENRDTLLEVLSGMYDSFRDIEENGLGE